MYWYKFRSDVCSVIAACASASRFKPIVGQSRWLGYTLGVTMDDLVGSQCGAVVGLHPRDDEFLSGNAFNGVWYGDLESSAKHQQEMSCAPCGDYEALVTSPLTAWRKAMVAPR